MPQPSVASYFNTRKRAADEEINAVNNKVFLEEINCVSGDSLVSTKRNVCPRFISVNNEIQSGSSKNKNTLFQYYSIVPKKGQSKCDDQISSRTRSGRNIKRIGFEVDENAAKIENEVQPQKHPKLVKFVKRTNLSPRKKLTPSKDVTQVFESKESNVNNSDDVTPVKVNKKTNEKQIFGNLVRKELTFDEVKTKISRSAKLQELKASLGRIKELENIRKTQEENNRRLKNGEIDKNKNSPKRTLKEFKTIELEILTSPRKGLSTPTKLVPPAPDKNELMSPKKTATPKRLIFSPSKDGSPSKLVVPPAYQRFLSLAQSSKAITLPLPYKYRLLLDVFKSVDSVVAMFFNRKEVITFKKLKPAVQRMLRKNFFESHLAQIKQLYPDSFNFHQMKMRNYGSISKQDYFQLVITPNVNTNLTNAKMTKIDEDNVFASGQDSLMSPQVIIARQQKFQNILLAKVKEEHAKFIKSLNPPMEIDHNTIRRWHPEFDLENCPEIELSHLPQPPNIEKYSSAKDILSTARNLFNCATPMERAMERYEAKCAAENQSLLDNNVATSTTKESTPEPVTATLLKGVPKSLLEKIRAKQAAKALDAMVRRPSQEKEATQFSRLPDIARHLRNVFITEKKGVLPLDAVVKKVENSFRTNLSRNDIELHIRLLAKQCPDWIMFHDIREKIYMKLNKNLDLGKIIEKLENIANEKLK